MSVAALPSPGDNIFDDAAKAHEWAKERSLSGVAARSLALATSPEIIDRTLVFHTFVHHQTPTDSPPAQTSCLIGPRAHQTLQKLELQPIPPPPATPLYAVRPVEQPGRANDRGLFAAVPISAGDKILVERPALMSPLVISLSGLNVTKEEIYARLFHRLSDITRTDVVKLKNSKGESVGIEEGIVRTNGVAISLDAPGDAQNELYSGVFVNLSRCNHSCGPNAMFRWNPKTFSVTLFAVRPIESNEEITIAYTDLLEARAIRQQKLQITFGFACKCEFCEFAPPKDKSKASEMEAMFEKSDESRALLQTFLAERTTRQKFSDWVTTSHNRGAKGEFLKPFKPIVEAIDKQGLHSYLQIRRECSDINAQYFGAMAKVDKFGLSLDQAIATWMIGSEDSPAAAKRIDLYKSWKNNPSSYPWWNKLKKSGR